MSFVGHYVLLLTCDKPDCQQRDKEVTGYSSMHAMDRAVEFGWKMDLISCAAFCPIHANDPS